MKLEVNSNAELCPKANLFMYFGVMGSGACENFKRASDLLSSLKGTSIKQD